MRKTKLKVIRAAQAISSRLAAMIDSELARLAAEKKHTLLLTKAREVVRERGPQARSSVPCIAPCGSEPREDTWRVHGA